MVKSNRLESSIEGSEKLRDWVKDNNLFYIKLKPTVIGIPDRLIIGKDRLIFFIEFKRPGKKPTKIQTYIHNKLREYGFNVYTCTTLEEVKKAYKIENKIQRSPNKGD